MVVLAWLVSACYVSLFLYATMGWKKRDDAKSFSIKSPFCSVVIAARDEEDAISDLCNDLCLQDYPEPNVEFIIVNDHSTDKTKEILLGIAQKDKRFKVLDAPNSCRGKKQALQFAVPQAKGEYILFTDADCRIHSRQWIRTYMSYAPDEPNLVFGNVIPVREKSRSFSQRCFQLDFIGILAMQSGLSRWGHAFSCNGANMMITKKFAENHYNLNDKYESGDDVFLLHVAKRIDKSKVIAAMDESCAVHTKTPATLKSFFSQRMRWASKATGYKDTDSIVVSVVVYLMCFLCVALSFSAICTRNPLAEMTSCGLFVSKYCADILLFAATGHYYMPHSRCSFLITVVLMAIFEIFHIFYITLIPLASLFCSPRWKNRKI